MSFIDTHYNPFSVSKLPACVFGNLQTNLVHSNSVFETSKYVLVYDKTVNKSFLIENPKCMNRPVNKYADFIDEIVTYVADEAKTLEYAFVNSVNEDNGSFYVTPLEKHTNRNGIVGYDISNKINRDLLAKSVIGFENNHPSVLGLFANFTGKKTE